MAKPAEITSSLRSSQIALFLEVLRGSGTVTAACQNSGIPISTVYRWKDLSPCFAEKWDQAIESACDDIESKLQEAATLGDFEYHIHKGEPVFGWFNPDGLLMELHDDLTKSQALEQGWTRRPIMKRKRDTTAAIFLLKARRPEIYREQRDYRLSGHGGGPIETRQTGVLVVPEIQDLETWGNGTIIVEED